MTSREILPKENDDLVKVYEAIQERKQNGIKVGLGNTYSYKEFFLFVTFGILFVLGGCVPLTVGIISIFYPLDSSTSIIFIWIIAIILEVIGITTTIHFTKKYSRRNDDLLENEILRRAIENKGIIREHDFYVHPFSRWRSKRMIKRFLDNGIIEIKECNAEGNTYHIPYVLSQKEKDEAKGVFDYE